MIIKCSHCAGKMRVDDSRIPKGQRVKVRCPHCKGIGIVQDQSTVDQASAPEVTTGSPGVPEDASAPPRTASNGVSEHTLPSDAFHSFRFPSEREAPLVERTPASRGFGIVTWILVSLGVVGLFALLVNIILSGPAK
ncbi:MAG: zinc-ribbon domain-containing protein [Desulfomonilaceae bacterium]